jgi:glycosyltransferase involved in cell wall biosynthesis
MSEARLFPAVRILITVDAVGGVWRYAMDLAAALKPKGFSFLFVGLGPSPSPDQTKEALRLGTLHWLDVPLDWMSENASDLDGVGSAIRDVTRAEDVNLVHLNLPSQAAQLDTDLPVIVMSHSCVITWFNAVRGGETPSSWRWHKVINRKGFARADLVLAPSHSHANMLKEAYGPIENLRVVHNACGSERSSHQKSAMVVAAARWWDEGKNGRILDEAARAITWPVIMAGSNSGPGGQYLPIRHARHPGVLTHKGVMTLMRQSSIFVSPSLYEPFGLAAVEAARAGNALVLADIPTYRELWEDAALFADPWDAQAFASAINRFCQDEMLRSEFAVKAEKRASQFSLSSQARTMANLYARLLHRDTALVNVEVS